MFKYVERKRDNKDPSSNILPNEWFDYFKKLMNIDYNNNFNDNNFSFDDSQNCNTELNCSIAAEEVVLAMKSPKNTKYCSPDGIINEMLKIVCNLTLGFFYGIIQHYF
jgi:hypothetical protein